MMAKRMMPGIVLALSVLVLSLPAHAQAQDTIKIATFNIQIFGKSKSQKPEVMDTLAEIVRKYDVVAIQEIKNKPGDVPPAFKIKINEDGAAYDFIISERTGKNPDDASSREQYAVYFDTAAVEVLDAGVLYDDSLSDHFQREPFVTHLKTKQGNFSFVLITIHTRPAAAVEEIAALELVIEWARGRYPEEDDFIALGDFNAGCDYASEDELDAIGLSGPQYVWIVPHSADTNLATSSQCAYDRIVTTWATESHFTEQWGVDQAFTDKKVSDHWPVWAEFFVNQDGGTQ